MRKDDNDLKQMAIQWVRDGDGHPVASLLERCDLQEQYVDDAYELFGDTITTIVDIEAFSTRPDLVLSESENGEPETRILNALRAVMGPG